jgi:hypothetical protein
MRKHCRRIGILILFFGFFLRGTATAQLEGRLFLDKTEYVRGEPIYLHFEAKNTGSTPIQTHVGNSYGLCGGYRIELSNIRCLPARILFLAVTEFWPCPRLGRDARFHFSSSICRIPTSNQSPRPGCST